MPTSARPGEPHRITAEPFVELVALEPLPIGTVGAFEIRNAVAFNPAVVQAIHDRQDLARVFRDALVFQPPADKDPTPPDLSAAAVVELLVPAGFELPTPRWQCVPLFDHPGCGAVWLKRRTVCCPCGGYVGRVEGAVEWPVSYVRAVQLPPALDRVALQFPVEEDPR